MEIKLYISLKAIFRLANMRLTYCYSELKERKISEILKNILDNSILSFSTCSAIIISYHIISMHAPEGYSSHLVCRSVNLSTSDLSEPILYTCIVHSNFSLCLRAETNQ